MVPAARENPNLTSYLYCAFVSPLDIQGVLGEVISGRSEAGSLQNRHPASVVALLSLPSNLLKAAEARRVNRHTHCVRADSSRPLQAKESRHPDSKVWRGLSKGSVRATVRSQ